MKPTLFLDLDGVMADFDGYFPVVFGIHPRELFYHQRMDLITKHPSFFRDLPPIEGALEFFQEIKDYRPVVLTSCPSANYAVAAQQKRAWVREHLGNEVMVLPVLGGATKPLFLQHPRDILIDDWSPTIEAWSLAGGAAILHRSYPATLDALSAVIADGPSCAPSIEINVTGSMR